MKNTLLLLLSFIAIFPLQAQLIENFEDGNFSENPTWFGSVTDFIINADNELQSNASSGGVAYLTLPANTVGATTWEFYMRLEFAPSTSNQARIYLNASQANLTGSLNGYFFQVGASGNTDALEFRRQDGNSSTLLWQSEEGGLATNPELSLSVSRTEDGTWTIEGDLLHTGETLFAMVNDDTYNEGSFFGFYTKFTSTRTDKFFFDDISIDPVIADTQAPEIDSVEVITSSFIYVNFNEALQSINVENVANYALSPGNITIQNAELSASNPQQVRLSLSENLVNNETYTLSVNGLLDLSGNETENAQYEFTYIETTVGIPNDILINEIMADPTPIVGLPELEFVELYNRSETAIQLRDFKLQDAGTSFNSFPSYILLPGAYVILVQEGEEAAFSSFGNVLGIAGLPALNNSGDDLSLVNSNDIVIHQVSYRSTWHGDDEKANGGWSLELINPNLYCGGQENWTASENPNGGTPGTQNSVYEDTPDTTAPTLLSATAISNQELLLRFSETMDENSTLFSENYRINPGDFTIVDISFGENQFTVNLTLAETFDDRQAYTLTANDVYDCIGNIITENNTATFTYYETEIAERYDILINEIYSNPEPSHGLPEVEFVELYNRSDKAINLRNYTFLEGSSSNTLFPFYILLPDSYVILQEEVNDGYESYGDVISLSNFNLSNSGETLQLKNATGKVIDVVSYTDDWYTSGREDGYSLERISTNNYCLDADFDWGSSLADIGGTPGTQNSIFDNGNPDEEAPLVKRAYVDRDFPSQVEVFFNEALDPSTAIDIDLYSISPDNNGLDIEDIYLSTPKNEKLTLQLSADIEGGTIYTLQINADIEDCRGNKGDVQTTRFAYSDSVEVGDIVLNEILYNPNTGGSRYVELYNRSEKVLDAKDFFFAKKIEGDIIAFDEKVETGFLIFPEDYPVFTPHPYDIASRYPVENPNWLIDTSLPSYDDDEDRVVLMTYNSKIIDELDYDKSFHNALLDDRNGVALERINPEGATQSASNWTSAAANTRYGTPTFANSQFFSNPQNQEDNSFLQFSTKRLSPDGDGFEDILNINYTTSTSGFLATIKIYDSRGRLIRTLEQQELLANEGTITWDGSTDDNEKANLGIYILTAEIINPDGTVIQEKEAIVVAGKLDN